MLWEISHPPSTMTASNSSAPSRPATRRVPGARVARSGAGVLWTSAAANAATPGNRSVGKPAESAEHRPFHARGPRGRPRAEGPRRVGQPAGHDGLGGGTGERRLAGQHLVENAGQAVLIAPGIDGLRGRLLGAHVGGRAD